ncbi:hypothetical protein GCM10009555_061940 [Acrocarpospora macrocephala]|uniref:Periplasmic binding protein domain-containing protein n=1 Tax=Acrocarpospora macrocephala TaxID=150177 RepID=A0A5M3WKC2_9ACTN|nr:substrate-binding domain-containing protein [Acrocarpospora macrocephala]GES09637.1 hypothetical protein Amac_032330 [Acrocarpospora macrocephala]
MNVKGRTINAKALALVVSAAVLTVTAACGAAEKTSDAGSEASAEFVKTIDDYVAKMKEGVVVPPPTEGPTAVPGKKIAIVTITQTDPGANSALQGLQEGAEAIGWKQTTYNANGNQADANRFMQQAITTKPDAIVVLGLNNTQTGSGLAAAKKANIPVACLACWDENDPDALGTYVTVDPGREAFAKLGYGDAAYAFQATDGNPRFLTFNDPSLSNLAARQEGFDRFLSECKEAGGSCEVVAEKKFQVAETTTALPGQAAALARANPDFNVVWASFDSAGIYVMNGLRQAAASDDDAFMVAANGDPEALDILKQGSFLKMTMAFSSTWSGWSLIDNLNRHFSGEPVVEQVPPFRIFDDTNIDEAATWDGGADYRADFKKIWVR